MQKLTKGFVEIYVIKKAMTSQKLYDVITFTVMKITTNPYVSFCIFDILFHRRKMEAA